MDTTLLSTILTLAGLAVGTLFSDFFKGLFGFKQKTENINQKQETEIALLRQDLALIRSNDLEHNKQDHIRIEVKVDKLLEIVGEIRGQLKS